MTQKYIYNPLTQSLEERSNPSPHISSTDPKQPSLPDMDNLPIQKKPKVKEIPKKNDPAAGAKYIPKDQRLFENLKVPGYETPAKSDKSYKHYLQDRVSDKITMDDWRNETPIYRKHLADIIADEQTNIRWDTAGGWRDKWGDPKTGSDALKEQQEIQKTYDEIFTPGMQKKYEEVEEQKKQKRIANHTKLQWGILDKKDKIKPNGKRRDTWKEFVKTGQLPKLSPEEIKRARGPHGWDVIYKNMSPIERGQWNAAQRKKNPTTAKLNKNITPPEIKKEDTPTYSSTTMMHELNELAEMKLRDQIQTKKFDEIMRDKRDPDLAKGINSLPGNEPMKKEFTKLPKFRNRSQRIRHARNTLGIGPYLTGETD